MFSHDDQQAPVDRSGDRARRTRVSQSDVSEPHARSSRRIPQAIADSYAKEPATPLQVGIALDMKPTTGHFRTLCGAALGYGLTDGGPFAKKIGLTDLGRRLVSPLEEGDDDLARREAVLTPTVQRGLLERYDGSKMPSAHIVRNVLEDLGVPVGATERVYRVIMENARSVGFIRDIKGDPYVDLSASEGDQGSVMRESSGVPPLDPLASQRAGPEPSPATPSVAEDQVATPTDHHSGASAASPDRVFISYAKSDSLLEQIADVVEACGFDHIVAPEEPPMSAAEVQDEIEAFRRCSAGIIRVSQPERVTDGAGRTRLLFDPDELIQLGRARAQFGSKIVVLVDEPTELPRNLRFAHEVQMSGDELETFGLMTLLRALSEFRQEQPASPDAG